MSLHGSAWIASSIALSVSASIRGSTPELDAQFDRLISVHRWLERRLGN
jgi:hypothetical protein